MKSRRSIGATRAVSQARRPVADPQAAWWNLVTIGAEVRIRAPPHGEEHPAWIADEEFVWPDRPNDADDRVSSHRHARRDGNSLIPSGNVG